jgi:hypothetical protein
MLRSRRLCHGTPRVEQDCKPAGKPIRRRNDQAARVLVGAFVAIRTVAIRTVAIRTAVHKSMAEGDEVDPVIRVQMRNAHRAKRRERSDADFRSEWSVRAVAEVKDNGAFAGANEITGASRARVRAIRTSSAEREER